jgi:septal ring factor EnvC (AmiA/AmiB activator)
MLSGKIEMNRVHAFRAAGLAALALFFAAACCAPAAFCQTAAAIKKKDLEEINRQLDEKKQELEKYRAEEELISRELSRLRKEEKQTSSRRREMERQLTSAKARSGEARQKYVSLERSGKELSGAIHGELVMYSLQKDFYYPYFGLRDISKDMLMRSAMFKKRALLSRITGESVLVNRDIKTLSRKGEELKSRQALLARQGAAQKTQVRTKQGELEHTRELQARLSREVENLNRAALGLNRLVKKLQKQAPYRSTDFSADIPVEKGSLTWPAVGRVISKFGREDVPDLKTWIVREGIRIATEPSAPVVAALAGKVIYAGPFRTYGNVVIVDHEKGFFTVYGLLGSIDADKDQAVNAGTPLGRSGEDTQAISSGKKSPGSAVYFEIRKGDRAIDPMPWLPSVLRDAP